MTRPPEHVLGPWFYRLEELCHLARQRPRLVLDPAVAATISRGADFVARKATDEEYLYGVNTGFGSLCETRVEGDEMELLQRNHVLSHACGVGEPVAEEIARLVMLTKLLTLRSGRTGISLVPVERLLDFWNAGCIPAIPQRGTVGASGDLAPLAHMALPLLGLGAFLGPGGETGTLRPAEAVLAEHGWSPLVLRPKEGLALTNGVQYINAFALHCLMRIVDLAAAADVVAAVSVQAFSGSKTFYDARYHATSFHRERRQVAANLTRLLDGSNHHRLPTCNRSKQDPYSFRCLPQVHGAVRQLVGFARATIENEVNGVSDNPLFFPEDDAVLFGGNLHGQSTAFMLDLLAMAVAELASISERRTYQLLSGRRGLPDFLVAQAGCNSGLMIAQYTAAALVNEAKVLAHPASVDTIPTCQLQEDSVSMGGTAAYKLLQGVENLSWVLGIELLAAAQAVELLAGLEPSPVTRSVVEAFRTEVAFLDSDRVLAGDLDRARDFIVARAPAWRRELALWPEQEDV